MSASGRRSGTPTIVGGLLLAASSIAAAIAIDPAEGGLAGTLRVWAIGTFIAGTVVAISGALPSPPADATRSRPRLRGLLLAGTAALVATLKVSVDRESSWLTVIVATLAMIVGVADVVGERRRVRAQPDAE